MQQLKSLILAISLGLAGVASADAPLQARLGLDPAQSRQLAVLEANFRHEFAALRQDYNREMRALRRARLANDSAGIERLTAVTAGLRQQATQMRVDQDAFIAALLRPDQRPLFEAYVEERRQMVGSSRDERMFD